jgi:hypothetical protein
MAGRGFARVMCHAATAPDGKEGEATVVCYQPGLKGIGAATKRHRTCAQGAHHPTSHPARAKPPASMAFGLQAFCGFCAFNAFHASNFFVASDNKIDCFERDYLFKILFVVTSVRRCIMRSKLETNRSPASPDDYRQFAVDSMRRCLAIPSHLRRSRMLHLMLAKAWQKLADQAEELRSQRPPSAAA